MNALKRTYAWAVVMLTMIYVAFCFLGPEKYVSTQRLKIRCSNQKLAWALSDFNEWKMWFKDWDLSDTSNFKLLEHP